MFKYFTLCVWKMSESIKLPIHNLYNTVISAEIMNSQTPPTHITLNIISIINKNIKKSYNTKYEKISNINTAISQYEYILARYSTKLSELIKSTIPTLSTKMLCFKSNSKSLWYIDIWCSTIAQFLLLQIPETKDNIW